MTWFEEQVIDLLDRIAVALEQPQVGDVPACSHPAESMQTSGTMGAVVHQCGDCGSLITAAEHTERLS